MTTLEEDDDKLKGSSLSLGFFPQMQKLRMSWEAPDSLSYPGFFSSVNSLVASPLDASLLYPLVHGDVTTP